MERYNPSFGANIPSLEDLRKAIDVSYALPPQSGGDALRAYSIDGTMRSATFQSTNIKLWKRIPKVKAYSTVEEYVITNSYGQSRAGAFIASGDLPNAHDAEYERKNKPIKYLATTRSVTHQAMAVQPVVVDDLVAQQVWAATMFMLGVLEKSLFKADSDVVAEEFDGIYKEITKTYKEKPTSGIVIDLGGGNPTKEMFTAATSVILNNYGTPSVLYTDLETMARINQLFYQNQFVTVTDGTGIVGGVVNKGFAYNPGETFEYLPDVFLRPNETPLTDPVSDYAPSAPTVTASVVTGAANAPDGESSHFDGAVAATYIVSAVNKHGESVGSTAVPVSVEPGDPDEESDEQYVTLTIAPATESMISKRATGFVIYRSDGAGVPKEIARIGRSTTANTTFYDCNQRIPGTGIGYLLFEDFTNLAFKQLLPMTKLDLATIDTSIRWAQILYGSPILFTPLKNVIIKNIGIVPNLAEWPKDGV